ncbi:hypothetical protein CBS101457_006333 [Exobasidium rhododendri]|nr:hypothetical protein CBS101457_006333 [Exobasidium rhododendri]
MTISSSPILTNGRDWSSFAQQSNSSNNILSIPPASSPSPRPLSSSKIWGSQLLGGETVDKRLSQYSSHNNDPIGSRPNSRTDAMNQDGSLRPIGSQRASSSAAAGVFAAASSAANRSRANSPANFGVTAGSDLGGAQIGMMGLGTHPFRQENSSSPSFVTAFSYSQNDIFNSALLAQQRKATGTPRLVVEGFQSSDLGGIEDEQKSTGTPHAFSATQGDESSNGDGQSPLSPTGSASAALASITAFADGQQLPSGGYPFPPPQLPSAAYSRQILDQRLLPSRTDTAGSANSNGSGRPAISSPAPYLTLPNTSNSSNTGLLSPTAATQGSAGIVTSAGTFSPFASPSRAGSAQYTHQATMRDGIAENIFRGADQSSIDELPLLEKDGLSPSSSVLLDILQRLARVESSVKDIHRNISGLSRNVSLLLDRTKSIATTSNMNASSQRNTASTLQQINHQQLAQKAASMTTTTSDEINSLNAQIALLSSSVSLLMSQGGVASNINSSNTMNSIGTPTNSTPLAGLGLGSATPQFPGGSNMNNTPQHGTSFTGTPNLMGGGSNNRMSHLGGMNDSPRMGGGNNLMNQHQQSILHAIDRSSRLSPRPGGASPGPTSSSRRWNPIPPGTPDVSTLTPHGAMNPPDPSIIVTKWEHLNLHHDLLRCILKYGLGPPNKIQQRALPFLLRGSDIIAQAPPTQERIASYVIPALQLVLNVLRGEAMPSHLGIRGPIALIISTTVDQATQAQRMALGLGASLGIRVHIAAASSLDVSQEATGLIQSQPQIVVGTPQKMMDLFNYLANKTKGAISLEDIRMVVLDEVDQLIARNLADYVSTLLRILPQPRMIQTGSSDPSKSSAVSPGLPSASAGAFNPFEASKSAPTTTSSTLHFTTTDRQTAIFSNTVPQDVLNFAQSIHLRESVRVLVRREGGGQGLSPAAGNGSVGGGLVTGPLGTSHSNLSASALSLGASAGQMYPQQGPINTPGPGSANHNFNQNPVSDPFLSSLRGLRQYYLYVAVSTGGNNIGGLQSPNLNASQISHAIEMKLDVITDLLEDIDYTQAIIYTSSSATHEAVTYKLASKGIEALALHKDMANITRQQVLAKYRSSNSSSSGINYHAAGAHLTGHQSLQQQNNVASNRPNSKKALVVYDVVVSPKDVHQVPLIVFYDLPKSVDEYKEKISCAASGGIGRPSVCVNVVTGSGGPRGDIEMLRSLESHLGCKMAELPMNTSQLLNF